MRIALAVVLVPCLAAAAAAADLKVPSTAYPTIQAAASAAAPGDRILVAKGVYQENVILDVPNVSILGKKAIWDGTVGGVQGNCLTADGTGLVVQGFTFRNATFHLNVTGGGLTVKKCTFLRSDNVAVLVSGDGTSVSSCVFRGNNQGVYVSGGAGKVTGCRFLGCEGTATKVIGNGVLLDRNVMANTDGDYPVEISGDFAVVSRNVITTSTYDAVYVTGSGATVTGNTITNMLRYAITLAGQDAVVSSNKMTFCGYGAIELTGANARVTGNKVQWTFDNAINVQSDGFTVTGNQVLQATNNSYAYVISNQNDAAGGTFEGNLAADTAYHGIYIQTDGADILNNTALRCGSGRDAGFWISGNGNTVTGNKALECDGDGFLVTGDDNTFTGCEASGGTDSGFVPSGNGNTFKGCTAKGFGGQGFDNNGTNTEVTGCTFLGNRIDLSRRINTGATFATVTGNTFSSGGVDIQTEIF
jgi:parallel beta-helix repeat protein